jgi:hypothetical protein
MDFLFFSRQPGGEERVRARGGTQNTEPTKQKQGRKEPAPGEKGTGNGGEGRRGGGAEGVRN